MSLIEVTHLRKEYPNVTPLADVSFDVDPGDVISVIGPSGTGKSTLLRCLNRLEEPTSGTIVVDGDEITSPSCDVTRIRRKMGMVSQSFNLFDNLNVLDNVCVAPIKLLHVPAEEARARGMELLERVGLADKAQNFADDLSGGQQQRVAIARAVAMQPKILLLDEPTSALDPTMIAEVLAVIRELAREGMTMMIVTHEMRFARTVSNRVFYMDEGGIYEQGSPEQIFEHPTREKTRQFIKRLKKLHLSIDSSSIDYLGAISQLERFGSDAALSSKMLRNVTLALEELVFQCIVPSAREQGLDLTIDVLMEHAESDDALVMQLRWDGHHSILSRRAMSWSPRLSATLRGGQSTTTKTATRWSARSSWRALVLLGDTRTYFEHPEMPTLPRGALKSIQPERRWEERARGAHRW